MSSFELWKFLHVIASIVWLGAGITLYLQFSHLGMKRDTEGILRMTHLANWMGPRVFAPAAVATLVFGVIMVVTTDGLEFSEPFITIGFIGVIGSFILGNVFTEKRAAKYVEIAEAEGHDAAALEPLGKQIGMFSLADILLLTVVVWAMIVKP